MSKPSLPQGTRDFGPAVVRKRNYILQTIRTVFELYGYEPLETPAMENMETLLGKYGDEGDKLIFKILNNGLSDAKNIEKGKAAFENVLAGKNDKNLTERALRYDLTIPFARYVAMNHGQLALPFKRYQIQPVWRADRPQKGRYREFYQCDADVVGSKSLINEVELCIIYATVFEQLDIDVTIKINNRKILGALAEVAGATDKFTAITVAIDKLDKIGIDKVKEELATNGLQPEQIAIVENYISINGTVSEKLQALQQLIGENETGKTGLQELQYVTGSFAAFTGKQNLELDTTLARGLNYYTGCIFEIKANHVQMGSIGGGGRYDDLTGLFGVPNVPGVGISFGVDRIYDVLEELQAFPAFTGNSTKVLFFNLGEQEAVAAFTQMQLLRKAGISSELYHENAKFDKQFKYAEKKQIAYIVIIGTQELTNGVANVKNLATGEQVTVALNNLAAHFVNL